MKRKQTFTFKKDIYWSINNHKEKKIPLTSSQMFHGCPSSSLKESARQAVGAVPALASVRSLKCVYSGPGSGPSRAIRLNEEGAKNDLLCGDGPFTRQDTVNWLYVQHACCCGSQRVSCPSQLSSQDKSSFSLIFYDKNICFNKTLMFPFLGGQA